MVSTRSERGFIFANADEAASMPHIDISKLLGAALEATGIPAFSNRKFAAGGKLGTRCVDATLHNGCAKLVSVRERQLSMKGPCSRVAVLPC